MANHRGSRNAGFHIVNEFSQHVDIIKRLSRFPTAVVFQRFLQERILLVYYFEEKIRKCSDDIKEFRQQNGERKIYPDEAEKQLKCLIESLKENLNSHSIKSSRNCNNRR